MRNLIDLVESADADPLGIVASIKDLEHDFKVRANLKYTNAVFHLSPCHRCNAPVWQQPCPVCDYYPRGNEDGQMRIGSEEWNAAASRYRAQAFEGFERHIHHYGNIAAWFFSNYRNTVAYKEDGFFKRVLEEVIKEVSEMTFPDAEHIWRAYGKEI